MPSTPRTSSKNEQETAALALAWISRTDDLLSVFLGSTGLSVETLRHDIDTPEMLAAVLDFLLMDDAWVTRFCAENGLPPHSVMEARQGLPGGASWHWT